MYALKCKFCCTTTIKQQYSDFSFEAFMYGRQISAAWIWMTIFQHFNNLGWLKICKNALKATHFVPILRNYIYNNIKIWSLDYLFFSLSQTFSFFSLDLADDYVAPNFNVFHLCCLIPSMLSMSNTPRKAFFFHITVWFKFALKSGLMFLAANLITVPFSSPLLNKDIYIYITHQNEAG